jgi:hypothetical protein
MKPYPSGSNRIFLVYFEGTFILNKISALTRMAPYPYLALPPILSIESQLFVYSVYKFCKCSLHWVRNSKRAFVRIWILVQISGTWYEWKKVLVWHWQVWTYQAGPRIGGFFHIPLILVLGTLLKLSYQSLVQYWVYNWIFAGYMKDIHIYFLRLI